MLRRKETVVKTFGEFINDKLQSEEKFELQRDRLNPKRWSLAFITWVKQMERLDYLSIHLCNRLALYDLIDYSAANCQALDRLGVEIARHEFLSQLDLERLKGIDSLKKATKMFRKIINYSRNWAVEAENTGEREEFNQKKLDYAAQFFNTLLNYRDALSTAKIDNSQFVKLVKKLIVEIQEVKETLEIELRDTWRGLFEGHSIARLYNLITMCELAAGFIRVLEALLSEEAIPEFIFDLDFNHHFLDLPGCETINLHDPAYNNFC